jgi:hypothetical protein
VRGQRAEAAEGAGWGRRRDETYLVDDGLGESLTHDGGLVRGRRVGERGVEVESSACYAGMYL